MMVLLVAFLFIFYLISKTIRRQPYCTIKIKIWQLLNDKMLQLPRMWELASANQWQFSIAGIFDLKHKFISDFAWENPITGQVPVIFPKLMNDISSIYEINPCNKVNNCKQINKIPYCTLYFCMYICGFLDHLHKIKSNQTRLVAYLLGKMYLPTSLYDIH